MKTIEIRCPVGPKRLLSKLQLAGERPTITDGNLIEFSCSDCTKIQRRSNPEVFRILHRFNLIGELVESVEVMRWETDR